MIEKSINYNVLFRIIYFLRITKIIINIDKNMLFSLAQNLKLSLKVIKRTDK